MLVIYNLKSRTRSLVWLFFLIFIPFSPLAGQKFFFDNYGVKQGLSEQKVYTVLQDSKDFIWLGTASGVSRFDGKKFENFSSRNGLANYGVKCIIEDSLGYIWFGHLNGGITRYDGQKFEKINFDSLSINGDITSISQIKDKMWFTSAQDGAILIDFPVNDIKHMKGKQFLGGKEGLSPLVFGAIINKAGEFICVSDVGPRIYSNR
jgi:ligand-binding sensor domain-containing protein